MIYTLKRIIIISSFKEKLFKYIWKEIENVVLIDIDRAKLIYDRLIESRNLEGSLAEVGCYKGGVLKMMSLVCPEKKIYAFDTFSGFSDKMEYLPLDRQWYGLFSDVNYEKVREFLKSHKNIIFKKGVFPGTARDVDEKFSLIHIDGDIYSTTKSSLNFFYDKVVDNGFIFIDDYLWSKCEGVTIAVDEFFQNKERIRVETFSQCYVIKGLEEKQI